MDKYYKAEDIFALLDRLHNVSDGGLYYAIESLPTIEISEDCISREYLEELCLQTLIPKVIVNTDVELGINIGIEKIYRGIKEAPPSVVLTTEQSCETCKHQELYECRDCKFASSRFASKWERKEE